jgi:hypothetical protein
MQKQSKRSKLEEKMKKCLSGMLVLFLLVGMTAFAQQSDDDFVDVGEGPGILEASIGFQWNMTKVDDLDWYTGPSFAVSWRQYIMALDEDARFNFGYAVVASMSFISEMDFKLPGSGYTFTAGGVTYRPGQTMTVTSADANYLMNISFLAGASVQSTLFGGFGFVADLGLGAFADLAAWESPWIWQGRRQYLDIMAINVGVALNAGLQYRHPSPWHENGQFIVEFGMNFGYYFGKFSTIELYTADAGDKGHNKELHFESTGSFESANILRFGAPYIVIGFRF